MKLFFTILFLGVFSLAFGKNALIKNNFLEIKNSKVINHFKKKKKMKQPKTMLAFEYYYTVDWLYAETPFSHKLEAYA